MTKPPAELLEFLHGYDPRVSALAIGLRTLVLDEMAPCHEYIFAMRSKVMLLYGPTERVIADAVCSIGVFSKHVNLIFRRGTDLSDRHGILEGSGSAMRHIKLRKLSELDRPELRAYVREARKCAGLRRPRRRTPDDVITRVKKTRRADNLAFPRFA